MASVLLEFSLGKKRASYSLAMRYVGRQYLLSFFVAFIFFFLIFFVNQILLLAKQIPMEKIAMKPLFLLVLFAIPQFLLYTIPFASLTGASMAIGEFGSTNEILALRSVGFPLRRIYQPIIILSLVLSLGTYLISDVVLPYSASQYKQLYTSLLTSLPTLDFKSNSSNKIGNIIFANGEVDDNTIYKLLIMQKTSTNDDQILSSPKGTLLATDLNNYIYDIQLENPELIETKKNSLNDWSLATGSKADYSIDLTSQIQGINKSFPSHLQSAVLHQKINTLLPDYQEDTQEWIQKQHKENDIIAAELNKENPHFAVIANASAEKAHLLNDQPINFYLQYYRAELNKKRALSMACFFLVFMTFPLSFIRFKHGKFVGFGVSMLVAVCYWYLLFYCQLQIFSTAINPAFLLWLPDFVLFAVGILLIKLRKTV